MDKHLDFWNLMAYDYAGSWDSTAGHQANLYPSQTNPSATPFSTSAAIQWYVSHGVSTSKIVLGMPLYGRAFANTNGPGNSFSGAGEGSWEQGVWDYKALPQAGAQEHHDCDGRGACGASWSFDATKRLMISYDTAKIAAEKGKYVKQNQLGGGMWWESSGDKGGREASVEAGSLIGAFVSEIGGPARLQSGHNCLEYLQSKYENLRKGMPRE